MTSTIETINGRPVEIPTDCEIDEVGDGQIAIWPADSDGDAYTIGVAAARIVVDGDHETTWARATGNDGIPVGDVHEGDGCVEAAIADALAD